MKKNAMLFLIITLLCACTSDEEKAKSTVEKYFNTISQNDEKKAYEILDEDEVIINVNMNNGENSASAWGCDLSYDYVKINGEYRS